MLDIQVKTDGARIQIEGIGKRVGDLRPFFVNFWTYMQARTQLTFRTLKKGGTFRGVNWSWFADQYVRKDGTSIPAAGGVKRADGRGMVKGRLRGGGRADKDRIKPTSNLLRHRGVMYNAALTHVRKTQRQMIMDTKVNYAAYQNAMRPFQFFELPKDDQVAARMARKYIAKK